MVHFPALPSPPYVFRWRYDGITRRGFPHSDIPGSKLVCSSPRLFAAYRVLHRLLAPRHSPYALSSLTIQVSELMLAGIRDSSVGMVIPPLQENSTASARNSPLFFKHCECFEKNYRLQDIQLSKNPRLRCHWQLRRGFASSHNLRRHSRNFHSQGPPSLLSQLRRDSLVQAAAPKRVSAKHSGQRS